jgi:flagella basal body P-ring formation protein FlgA
MKRYRAPFPFPLPFSRLLTPWAIFACCNLVLMPAVHSAGPSLAGLPGSTDGAIESFLRSQTAGLPGTVGITIDTPKSGPLPACAAPQVFLPRGVRPWGRISVGVRCAADRPWTRYVQAHIAVRGTYYAAERPIHAGQRLAPSDVSRRQADLTTLPRNIVVDAAQFNGATAINPIAAGAPLRQESLRLPAAIQQGQHVKVSTQGTGFIISAEGKAMASAAVGARIQIKMQDGQLLSGVVSPDGTVERFN